MRQIKAQPLTIQDFAAFGSYVETLNPTGEYIGEEPVVFYRDTMTMHTSPNMMLGFSTLKVAKPEKMIIKAAEYHTYESEVIIPMNDDAIIHVAPASNKTLVPEKTKAFLVPKGTAVKLNPGVWHLAPMPVNEPYLHAMIVLAERVYANDCTVVEYDEKDYIEIVL